MTVTRLRPDPTAAELAALYPQPHSHTAWHDHRVRVQATIALARYFEDARSVTDLSCGDATIARGLHLDRTILGDLAPGYGYHGPIERTLDYIDADTDTGLFVLSETLEHLADPPAVLTRIRGKARYLVLSTPLNEQPCGNDEHIWAWSATDVEAMLTTAGWTPAVTSTLSFLNYPYTFGMWGCT